MKVLLIIVERDSNGRSNDRVLIGKLRSCLKVREKQGASCSNELRDFINESRIYVEFRRCRQWSIDKMSLLDGLITHHIARNDNEIIILTPTLSSKQTYISVFRVYAAPNPGKRKRSRGCVSRRR
jgi:hypothetical protein